MCLKCSQIASNILLCYFTNMCNYSILKIVDSVCYVLMRDNKSVLIRRVDRKCTESDFDIYVSSEIIQYENILVKRDLRLIRFDLLGFYLQNVAIS